INAVTINPAHIINKPYLSDFTEGQVANMTIFDVMDKKVDLIDSDRKILKGTKLIKERGVLANGAFIKL
ncbi:amidohydrolase, partial [Bacillus sp. MB366]